MNRVIVDANGAVVHELQLPLLYRGVNSLELNLLVVSIPRFNACFPNTIYARRRGPARERPGSR